MGIESVAFLFSKVFWVHGEHDMRTQVYYTVAVILCHNSGSKWRQWCCKKFQKSQCCTQWRQNNTSSVGIPFPSWAPQHRLCLWIPVPHSSKSPQLPPGATVWAKGHLWGLQLQLRDPVTAHGAMARKISNVFVKSAWPEANSQWTFPAENLILPFDLFQWGSNVQNTFHLLWFRLSQPLYVSGYPNFMNLSAFLWPSSPEHLLFFFSLLVGVAIAPARILWHVAAEDTIQSWYLSGWQRPGTWAPRTDLWQVSHCWFWSVTCWFWQGKAVAPDTPSQPRLTCCCEYLCSQITSSLPPVPLCQGQKKAPTLKTHPHFKSSPSCKTNSCAVQHVSEGDSWAVVSWLKALLHLLIAALTSELLKIS